MHLTSFRYGLGHEDERLSRWQWQRIAQVPLAAFFLKKLRGRRCDFNDLPSLDPELHANLLKLAGMPAGVEQLGLNFTIESNALGGGSSIPLMSGPLSCLVVFLCWCPERMRSNAASVAALQ